MNRLIITLCVLMEVAVIIAQKNDDLSSCHIMDKHDKDYFCNYCCHNNDTGIQIQKNDDPISVSPQKDHKTQNESYISEVEITTKTSLQRYSANLKSSTTTSNNIFNKLAARPPPFTSSTPSRLSVLSTGIQVQKNDQPISVSPQKNQKTQTESYISEVEKTTKTSLQRYSANLKSSTTTSNNIFNKLAARPPPFTSSTPSRPSVLSTVNSPSLSRYYLPSKSF